MRFCGQLVRFRRTAKKSGRRRRIPCPHSRPLLEARVVASQWLLALPAEIGC